MLREARVYNICNGAVLGGSGSDIPEEKLFTWERLFHPLETELHLPRWLAHHSADEAQRFPFLTLHSVSDNHLLLLLVCNQNKINTIQWLIILLRRRQNIWTLFLTRLSLLQSQPPTSHLSCDSHVLGLKVCDTAVWPLGLTSGLSTALRSSGTFYLLDYKQNILAPSISFKRLFKI